MTDTITTAALADLLGMSTRNVRYLDKRGILVRAGKDFALADSVRRYCAHLRDLATGRGGEVAISTATAERARLAKAQAEHIEMKNARARHADRSRGRRARMVRYPSRHARRSLGGAVAVRGKAAAPDAA